jgi:hypothetical protein
MGLAAAKHEDSLTAARFIAQLLGGKQEHVSINDVRKYVSGLQNASGSVFLTGEWECVGRVKTAHDEGHCREVRLWRLK